MKNYLKFIIVVSAITISSLTSIRVTAKEKDKDNGGCEPGNGICCVTPEGSVLFGRMNFE